MRKEQVCLNVNEQFANCYDKKKNATFNNLL